MTDRCANRRCRSVRNFWARMRASGFWLRERWFCSASCLRTRFSPLLERLISSWAEGLEIRHRSRLGSVLVDLGCLSEAQLAQVLKRQREEGGSLGFWAREMGFVSENELTEALSRQLNIPWIDDALPLFEQEFLDRIPRRLCLEFGMVPLTERHSPEALVVGLGGPVDLRTVHMLRKMLACEVEPYFTCERTVDELLAGFVTPFIDESSQEVEVLDPRPDALTRLVFESDSALSGSRVRVHLFGDTIWVRFDSSPAVQDVFLNLKVGEEPARPVRHELPSGSRPGPKQPAVH